MSKTLATFIGITPHFTFDSSSSSSEGETLTNEETSVANKSKVKTKDGLVTQSLTSDTIPLSDKEEIIRTEITTEKTKRGDRIDELTTITQSVTKPQIKIISKDYFIIK